VRGARPWRAQALPSKLGRFLTLSFFFHALLLAAGITGGAAYSRRSGTEGPPPAILFLADASPEPTAPVATASAEPARPLEREPIVAEPEPRASEEPSVLETAPLSKWEPASLPSPPAAFELPSDVLERVIGDPRQDWRLPSHEILGLDLGVADEPPVSDCCGEPQPAPAAPPEEEVYVYPSVLKMARAEFPVKSQRLGESGSVLLEMTVGPDGLVKGVRVAQSSGYSRLDDCAVNAAWEWVFSPATRNGVPETSTARHRYRFRLTGVGG
jgi:protein TonB